MTQPSRFQIVFGALVIIVVGGAIASFYTDFLWFQSLKQQGNIAIESPASA